MQHTGTTQPPGGRPTRRAHLSALGAIGGTALLTGCVTSSGNASGGNASSTPTSASTPAVAQTRTVRATSTAAAPVKITWFAMRDTTGFTPKQVDAFNTGNSRVQIDYQEQGATPQDVHDKLVTAAVARDPAADLLSMYVPYVPEFGAAGWIQDTEAVLPTSERTRFFRGTLEGVTYQGKLYAVPWHCNGPGLYYRKDLLQVANLQPPKTYDDLVAQSKKLMSRDVAGYLFQAAQTEDGIISWLEFLWGYGGDVVDDNLHVLVDRGNEGVDSMKRLVSFIYQDRISPEATLSMKSGSDAEGAFRDGRAVFLRLWMTSATAFDADTSKIKGKWDVTVLPSQIGKPGPGCLEAWNLGISRFSQHPNETAQAIQWLTSQEQQKSRLLGNGSLPARPAVLDDAEVKAKYAYADKVSSTFESLKPRPVTPYWAQMSADAIQPSFGAAVSRQKTPEQAIKDMADKLRSIFKP